MGSLIGHGHESGEFGDSHLTPGRSVAVPKLSIVLVLLLVLSNGRGGVKT